MHRRDSDKEALRQVSLMELVGYFLRLGAFGFGGPIALAGYMHRDLVPRGWITDQEYLEGIAFAQMMPGPLAAQLAMWIGFIRHGTLGASLVGIVFILPAFLLVLAISTLYVAYEGLAAVQSLFYGIGPAVIAIVALSAMRLAKATVGSDKRLWLIFAMVGLITLLLRAEIALLFIAAGLVGVILYRQPHDEPKEEKKSSAAPLAAFLPAAGLFKGAPLPVLAKLAGFFIKAGAFTFGSGLAIVPFLHEGVVLQYHWLTEREFLDAVAVGVITPGPVIITAAFVGYLVAGYLGAAVSAAGVFLPVYFFVLCVGRYIVRFRNNRSLHGFIKGATAAASGAIAGASCILAQGAIKDVTTGVIFLFSLVTLWRWRIPEPLIIGVAAVAGLALHQH